MAFMTQVDSRWYHAELLDKKALDISIVQTDVFVRSLPNYPTHIAVFSGGSFTRNIPVELAHQYIKIGSVVEDQAKIDNAYEDLMWQ